MGPYVYPLAVLNTFGPSPMSSRVSEARFHEFVWGDCLLTRSDGRECVSAGVEHFPCGNEGYDPLNPTDRTTSCKTLNPKPQNINPEPSNANRKPGCLPTFDRDYRPILGFETFLATPAAIGNLGTCVIPGPGVAPPSNWFPADDYVEIK